MREKPFTATLTDATRSFIQGYAGHEFYRLERGKPQSVSHKVAAALKETLYEVQIEGEEPAVDKIAETKASKGANDGRSGDKPGAKTSGSKGKVKEEKTGAKTEANGDSGEAGTATEQPVSEGDQHSNGIEHQTTSTGAEES